MDHDRYDEIHAELASGEGMPEAGPPHALPQHPVPDSPSGVETPAPGGLAFSAPAS